MTLKYGHTETYLHTLDAERLNWLTTRTNRGAGQTQFLYQLVQGDFEKLKQLEMQLKNCFCFFCPGTVAEMEEVMSRVPNSKWFVL